MFQKIITKLLAKTPDYEALNLKPYKIQKRTPLNRLSFARNRNFNEVRTSCSGHKLTIL